MRQHFCPSPRPLVQEPFLPSFPSLRTSRLPPLLTSFCCQKHKSLGARSVSFSSFLLSTVTCRVALPTLPAGSIAPNCITSPSLGRQVVVATKPSASSKTRARPILRHVDPLTRLWSHVATPSCSSECPSILASRPNLGPPQGLLEDPLDLRGSAPTPSL